MSELKVGDWLYQFSRHHGIVRQKVDRLTPKYGVLANGDRVKREIVGNTYVGVGESRNYEPETQDLLARYERKLIVTKAYHACGTSKWGMLEKMSTEDLTTIINIFNKY